MVLPQCKMFAKENSIIAFDLRTCQCYPRTSYMQANSSSISTLPNIHVTGGSVAG